MVTSEDLAGGALQRGGTLSANAVASLPGVSRLHGKWSIVGRLPDGPRNCGLAAPDGPDQRCATPSP